MKINFILPAIGKSGGINVVYKYASMFEANGDDVVIYKQIVGDNLHRYKSPIVNIIHQIYCTLKSVVRLLKKREKYDKFVFRLDDKSVRNADIIVATYWSSAYKVSLLDDKKGKKFYFIQDYEVWDNKKLVRESYLLPLNKIVISKWINNNLKKDLNIGPFPVVNNGINREIYKSKKIKSDFSDKVKFLMLNHHLPKKGVRNGLLVYESIKKEYPNIHLRMFGMNDNSNLPEYVEYYQNPTKQKIVDLYSDSDIFIFPSLEEGWGLTPLEAMACGCIVVGTKTGFVLDCGENRKNMMVSDPGDVKDMIKNIECIMADDKLREELKKNGMQTIKKLSWDDSFQKLKDIFENKENLKVK